MSEEYEIKRKISHLSSRLYGDIRTICGTEGLTQSRLEELIQVVTLDRIKLAFCLYACAKKLDAHEDKQDGDYRSIISRCYYCHYHLARAAIFSLTKDDIDEHEKLPKSLSKVLPSEYAEFIKKLEQYRGIRNEIEYSPYPEIDNSLEETAKEILQETKHSIELIVCCFRERGIEVDATI
ncbi:HEPN domain-containing protein [Candidatus Poribacteria bacterium]|nr:HEPN domain-containing protein [Candidatus Poribacteria bacterium]